MDTRRNGLLVVDKPGLSEALPDHPLADSSAQPSANPQRFWRADHPPTSHDIVQIVRRWSGEQRIGHTGTLDPLATGVLVLCLGQATRLVEYYQGHDKQYYAEVTLGVATDTYDALGQITERSPVPLLSIDRIEAVLAQFRGPIMQIPPVYSALKQGGESLHRKARRGEIVTPAPRQVTIHQLDLLDYQPPARLALRVVTSAGGYIRSLAYDLGQALGTHAHLTQLRREAAGSFTLHDARSLTSVQQAAAAGELDGLLLPAGTGLAFDHIQLEDDEIRRLGFGQSVLLQPPSAKQEVWLEGTLAMAMTGSGQFAGIMRCLGAQAGEESAATLVPLAWKAEKWFVSA